MSISNRMSEVIPQAVIDDVITKLTDCRTALEPYVMGLTEEERQTLFKMGDKTVATVQKVQSYIITNPELMPTYMNKVEFAKDVTVVTQLTPLQNMAYQLASDLDDTRMLAGSEALAEALIYYGSVKEAAKRGIPQAKPIYEELKERFTRRGTPKE
ncbi:hypothetical protein [Flavobacterium sp.]